MHSDFTIALQSKAASFLRQLLHRVLLLAKQRLLPLRRSKHLLAVVPDSGHLNQSLVEALRMALGQILKVVLAPFQPERPLCLGLTTFIQRRVIGVDVLGT